MCFSTSTVIKVSVLSFVSVLDKHGPLLSNLPAELVPVPVLTEDYCNTSTSMSTSQYQYQHRLIASEAYLSTGVWSRAHFPAPLEQPLVGRLPEPHQISNLFRDSFRSMRRIYVWAYCHYWSHWGFCFIFLWTPTSELGQACVAFMVALEEHMGLEGSFHWKWSLGV